MAIASFDGVWSFITDLGTLTLNQFGADGGYMFDVGQCAGSPVIRATKDNIPQADGSILHNRFLTGYEIQHTVELWADEQTPACATTTPSSTEMLDNLQRFLMEILRDQGRMTFDPGGGLATRLADELQTLQVPQVTIDNAALGAVTVVKYVVDSPFPYVIDFEQTLTTINATTGSVTNDGSAPFYPVWQVYAGGSPMTSFTLTNNTTGLTFVWDTANGGSAVPAGEYVEVDCFRNTIYLNGDGANEKGGIDIEASEFWPLAVGANSITTDADARLLWQAAWL